MKEQNEKFKKLLMSENCKTFDKITTVEISNYISVITDELERVLDSMDNNQDYRYVAITVVNITQHIDVFKSFSHYLIRHNKSMLEDKNKQEIIKSMERIVEISDLLYKALLSESIFSTILKAEKLLCLLRCFNNYCI